MWRTLSPKARDMALKVVIGALGVSLMLSPSFLGFTRHGWASWSAFLIGLAIVLIVVSRLIAEAEWEDFFLMALGIWAAIIPALLSFTQATEAALAHLLLGGAVTSVAALRLRLREKRAFSTMDTAAG